MTPCHFFFFIFFVFLVQLKVICQIYKLLANQYTVYKEMQNPYLGPETAKQL